MDESTRKTLRAQVVALLRDAPCDHGYDADRACIECEADAVVAAIETFYVRERLAE